MSGSDCVQMFGQRIVSLVHAIFNRYSNPCSVVLLNTHEAVTFNLCGNDYVNTKKLQIAKKPR